MSPEAPPSVNDMAILRHFWRASFKHKRQLYISSLSPIGAILFGTLVPFYFGKILASLSVNPHHAVHYLPYLLVTGVVGVLANRIGFANLLQLQAATMADLQTESLETLLRQTSSFHNNRVAGKLVSDAIDYPNAYAQLTNALLINILPFCLIVVSGIALVVARSWELGLVLVGMAGIAIGTAFWQSLRRKSLRKRRLAAAKAVTAHLADVIVNNQTVKTFAHEDLELAAHGKLSRKLLDYRLHDWLLVATDGNNRIAALLAFQVGYAFLIIHLVERDPGLLALGIFAFSYSMNISNNLFNINNMIRTVEDGLLQASPMVDIIQRTPEILDVPGIRKLSVTKGRITLQDVTFRYKDSNNNQAIFDKLRLDIAPGTKVGLVGPSGSGKSTLTRLLLRFEDIQAGEILVDGQNIAQSTQASLREAISYVPQEPLLFHRSVLENIAYGNPSADKEAVMRAAKNANAHEFIEQLPQGYDTLVGERGVKLSGGQRQRVAIARAILKDAPILILDEATSALDSESEVLIQDALQKLMKHKTAIVIAHRLSTIQKMDTIVVMDNGRIIEQGTHQELLKRQDLYASLWAHQSGGFIEE